MKQMDAEAEKYRRKLEAEADQYEKRLDTDAEKYAQQTLGYTWKEKQQANVMQGLADNEGSGSDIRNGLFGASVRSGGSAAQWAECSVKLPMNFSSLLPDRAQKRGSRIPGTAHSRGRWS